MAKQNKTQQKKTQENKAQPKKAQKPRLGRGLSSLITASSPAEGADDADYQPVEASQQDQPSKQPAATATGAHEIPVEEICPNPYQPRRDFRREELEELAGSIRQQGVLQPLIVARATSADADAPYVLIAGERRLRAARQAELETVPCLVKEASKQQMMEWALVENIHREDLSPMERAHAYREYLDRFDVTQADAAERLGQARTTVANHLRLLDLHENVQQMIAEGKLSFGHAKVLAGLVGEPDTQCAMAKKAVSMQLSVRQLEGLVAAAAARSNGEGKNKKQKGGNKPPHILDLQEQLTRCVGTRVEITPGRKKHSGRILIDYYSLDDFDRIAGGLGLQLED